tara:strand:+ start:134 stop:661 length:528 start_codon:yes stop_codon:yes gene_type:complete
MGKNTIKKNKDLGFGVFSGEFNPINYIFYLAILLSIKTCFFIFFLGEETGLGLEIFGILAFWNSLYYFIVYGWWNSNLYLFLFLFLLMILALLPIVYRILNGNGHRNFFIFLALNLVFNILNVVSGSYDNPLNIIIYSSTLIPLFIGFNPKEISNIDIKMSSKIKLSGNLYDDLD